MTTNNINTLEFPPVPDALFKIENFDEDNCHALLRDDLFSKKDRKRLSDYNKARTSGGTVNVQYKLAKDLAPYNLGRLYPEDGIGLQSFRFDMRNPLARKFYWDLDGGNAHYIFALKYALMFGIKCDLLRYYVENRKECLALVSTDRKIAKTQFLKTLYGGKVDGVTWDAKDELQELPNEAQSVLVPLSQEMVALADMIWAKFPQFQKLVKKKYNPKASLMSHIFQTEERIMLLALDKYLKDVENREMVTYIHDGGYVKKLPGETEFPKDVLLRAAQHLNDLLDYKGTLVLEQKPIEFDWVPPALIGKGSYFEWVDSLTYSHLAKRFITEFGDYVVKTKDGNLYVYYGSFEGTKIVRDGRWYNESVELSKLLRILGDNMYEILKAEILQAPQLKEDDKLLLLKLLRTRTDKKNEIKDFVFQLRSLLPTPKWAFDENVFLLGFDNGVYDLMISEFRPHKYDDYITLSTGYDFKEKENIENFDGLSARLDVILKNMEPDTNELRFKMQVLASTLDGINYSHLFFNNGEGGNCKGWSYQMNCLVLGKGYYMAPSNSLFIECGKPSSASPDIADMRYKRLIMFEETKTVELSVAKKMTGKCEFRGRQLFGDPTDFILHATIVVNSNSAPEIDGKPTVAEKRRFLDSHFGTIFTDDDSLVGTTRGESTYRKADKSIESEHFKESLKLIFLHKLLDTYKLYKKEDLGIEFNKTEKVLRRSLVLMQNLNVFTTFFNLTWKYKAGAKGIGFSDMWNRFIGSSEYKECTHKKDYSRTKFFEYLRNTYPLYCDNPRNNGWRLSDHEEIVANAEEEEEYQLVGEKRKLPCLFY